MLLQLIACKKLVEVETPNNSISEENVYTSDATASAVLTGIYAKISERNTNSFLGFRNGGFSSLSLFLGLSADELTLFDLTNATYVPFYSNTLTELKVSSDADCWKVIYPIVFVINAAIEGLSNSGSLTPSVKQHLLGEAKYSAGLLLFLSG